MDIIKIKVSDTPKIPDTRLKGFKVLGLDPVTNDNAHAEMEQLRGNTAFAEWEQKNPGKTYEDWIKKLQEPAVQAAKEAETAIRDANKATTDANASEELRAAAEKLRVDAETLRINTEKLRADAETKRVDAEVLRVRAEHLRVDAENLRVDAEALRVNAEKLRVDAEAKRHIDTKKAIEDANAATGSASKAADRLNILSDHRDEIRDGYWWRWNETTKEWYNTDELAQGKAVKVLDNGNYAHWNEVTQQYEDSGIEASASIDVDNIEVVFSEAASRENINTGEIFPILFGKIRKWFSSLKSLAFKDKVDWNADIDNKPLSMPASDVQAWAKAATKPTYDYSEIKNKPTIPVQVNSDWNAVGGIAEIKNKPTSMPANDVYAWAKAATKPAYTASEVGASPLNHTHNYQEKEDGKGLSANDFTNDYKSFVAFLLTSQSLTSTVNIPIAANTEVSISANMSLSISNSANLKPGYVMTIRINNTATAARTVTLPSSTTWVNDFGTTLSIAASSRAEVSVWCYKSGYYAIRVGEV